MVLVYIAPVASFRATSGVCQLEILRGDGPPPPLACFFCAGGDECADTSKGQVYRMTFLSENVHVAAHSLCMVTGKASICDTLNTFGSAFGSWGGETRSGRSDKPSALPWSQVGRNSIWLQKGSGPISGAVQ